MRKSLLSIILYFAFIQAGIPQLPYERIKDLKDTITYDLLGTQMVDNYHWMENWKSRRLKKWIWKRRNEVELYFKTNTHSEYIRETYFKTWKYDNYDYSKRGPYFCQVFNHGRSLQFRRFLNEQVNDSLLFDVGWCLGLGFYFPQIEELRWSGLM